MTSTAAQDGWLPSSSLPPLYARWVGDLLDGPVPRESEATCERCAMLAGDAAGAPADTVFFSPRTKCCTYVPSLPNFLAGAILADDDPALAAGRASLERRLQARLGVTPLAVDQSPVHGLLYRVGAAQAFGRSETLRCPHYLEAAGGACGIWRHRNGVCSTWFCKYERGATGQRFWQALDQLLATVERELARWCLVRLDVDPAVLARLLPRGTDRSLAGHAGDGLDAPALDGRADEAVYRERWGAWLGRERELYRAAARLVAPLAWRDVQRIGGASVEALARVVRASRAGLHAERIPARLVAGPLQAVGGGRQHVRVATYSMFDPLDLPRLLVEVLHYFDGRPTAQVLARIRRETGINLRPDLVRRLVDFRVLVPAAGEDG